MTAALRNPRPNEIILLDSCIVDIGEILGNIDRDEPLESRLSLKQLKGHCICAASMFRNSPAQVPIEVYNECEYAYEKVIEYLAETREDAQKVRGRVRKADPRGNVHKLGLLADSMKRVIGLMKRSIAYPNMPEPFEATVELVNQVNYSYHVKKGHRGKYDTHADEALAAMALYCPIWEGRPATVMTGDWDVFSLFQKSCQYIAGSPYVRDDVREALAENRGLVVFCGERERKYVSSRSVMSRPSEVVSLDARVPRVRKWLECALESRRVA